MLALTVSVLVALTTFLLWTVCVNLVLRSLFSLPIPLSPFGNRERKTIFQFLSFSQTLIWGVLYLGCGMAIATTLSRYLDWRYLHGSSSLFTRDALFRNVLEWIFGGVLFGIISFFSGSHVRSK